MQREHDELAEAALIDALTGLGNRRAFDARLAEEIARADALRHAALARDDRPRRLQGGQRPATATPPATLLLVRVGVLLSADAARERHRRSRYGGDEFAIILPDTSKTEAWVVAEKLRGALRDAARSTPSGGRRSST